MIVQICIGSSCHLKGSYEIVEMMKQAIDKYQLDAEVTLAGSFCAGKCNRDGVTIIVNDEVFTGVTVEGFDEFLKKHILEALEIKKTH